MLFTRVFAAAAFVASVVAQTTSNLQFTNIPSNVQVGKPVQIKWTGGDGSPVTITLKKGDPKDLKTITVLTGGTTGDTYTWTPTEDLEDGDDYALQISQGVASINYTGEFSIGGGNASAASTSGSSAAATSTTTVMSSSSTSTTSTVYATGASMGNMTMSRNNTMVSPTLSPTGGVSAGTGSAATATGSGSAPSSTHNAAASGFQAHFVLGAGALAAAVFAF